VVSAAPARRGRNAVVIWSMAAVVFWAAIAYLGVLMFNAVPRIAAFDLDLLVAAGRSVAAGQSPYGPAMLSGAAPHAVDLFYSYPPIVGQLLAPISGLPLGVVAIGWSILSIALLALAVVRIGQLVAPQVPSANVASASIAVAAMTFPLLIAVLFGNLDAFFPALYGAVLIAALSPQLRDGVLGGAAIAIGTLTKVYPGGLGLWFLVRAARARTADRRALLVTVAAAALFAAGIVAISVLLFGLAPWQDYATVASTAARAELVDGRNAAPAAQLALWLHLDSAAARVFHLPVLLVAVAAIAAAAWFVADPIESLAIAATASLFLLPVSWIHYPAALLPFGAAAVLRVQNADPAVRRRVGSLAAAALVAGALSIPWMPSLWIAVALTLLAAHVSALGAAAGDRSIKAVSSRLNQSPGLFQLQTNPATQRTGQGDARVSESRRSTETRQ
jgi:Glycosyltransferase family 87